jgi:hypothetical protein
VTDLWKVLGFEEIATRVSVNLGASADLEVLEGPPGCGKSWLAKGVGHLWELGGGRAIVVEGDPRRGDVALYPLTSAMRRLPEKFPLWEFVGKLAQASEALIGTGGALTEAIELLVKSRDRQRRSSMVLLDDAEQDILVKLEALSDDRPLLIIADNLHWWDSRSLDLLGSLRDVRMHEAFDFLSDVRLLAVQTTEPHQSAANPEARDALLTPLETNREELQRPPIEEFDQVLASLGAGAPPSTAVTEAVYKLSGGHLALASKCADRIAAGEGSMFLAIEDEGQFVRSLLSERIRTLGSTGRRAVELLEVAAVLGLTFNRHEMLCASQVSDSETARLLRFCRQEQILEAMDDAWVFVHEYYRRYFLELGGDERIAVHERWGECLRLLRPGDYELRCINARDGDSSTDAAIFGSMAALQAERDGRSWRTLPQSILDSVESCDRTDTVKLLVSALGHLNKYHFAECLDTLDQLSPDIPKPLRAERDYLRAMCLMSTRSEADRDEGRSILEAWAEYTAEEAEIGTRLMLLLLYGRSHLLDKEPAWELDGAIRRQLNDRASFDSASLDALYTLERSAASLYESDIAVRKCRAAVEYFGPEEGHQLVRRPVEYYRCLVNVGANLIRTAQYPDARDAYEEVDDLIASYPEGVFPRIDYPRMNRLLSEYRLGLVSPEQAVERQRHIVDELKVETDPFYVENALAVYLVLSGAFEKAFEILDRIDLELARSRSRPEPSMVYLIKANRCAAWFVNGEIEAAQREWPALASLARESAYAGRAVRLRRHDLLAELIVEGRRMTAREFDVYLVENRPHELGPLWETAGLGFRLPAVEFWREN